MKIYTAGPLGFSEAGRSFHNDSVIPEIRRLGHEPLDPWTLLAAAMSTARSGVQSHARIKVEFPPCLLRETRR